MTWIAPANKNLAFVTGSRIGLGFNPWPTFDWAVINLSTPLILPFFSLANLYGGTILGSLVLLGMYYSNYKYVAYMPPNLSTVYDRFGSSYNLSRVVIDGRLQSELYTKYSPPYISAGNLISTGATYCMFTFSFCYIMLNEWKIIKEASLGFWQGLRDRNLSNFSSYRDPISVMMRQYKEVPDWWFLIILALSFMMVIVGITSFPTTTPVWAVIVVILLCIVLLVPSMILFASTGFLISMNVIGVILSGYMVPGNGVASILCRIYGYTIDAQGETYLGDMKIGQYAKLPPRGVFRAQIYATLIQITVTASSLIFLLNGVDDFCSYTQAARFVCAGQHSTYSDSLLLGVIGPHRTFDVLYPVLKYAFLMGAGLSIPFWLLRKRFPNAFRAFQPVLILGGLQRFGYTYNLSYYTTGFYFSFAFMHYIRRRYLGWWANYNYIISSALTAGVAFSGIIIFLALQYHAKPLKWWGTTVSTAGVDGKLSATLLDIPERGYFGMEEGTWS